MVVINQDRTGRKRIELVVTPGSRTSRAPSADIIRRGRLASEALKVLGRDPAMRRETAFLALREYVKMPRRALKAPVTEPVYTVKLHRPGLPIAQYESTDKAAALRQARYVLQNERARRKALPVNGHGLVQASSARDPRTGVRRGGGYRLAPGWFQGELKRRKLRIVDQAKVPQTLKRYVGIEIECFVKVARERLAELILDAGLAENVSLVSDSSLSDNPRGRPTSIEVRVLATEATMADVVGRMSALLASEEVGAAVNKSCGLHVHLDCRKGEWYSPKADRYLTFPAGAERDRKRVYSNLVASLPLLVQMQPLSRRNNTFCKINKRRQLPTNPDDRYMAINPCSLSKHGTIEVRLSAGSVEGEKIVGWVKLLLAIVEAGEIKRFPRRLKSVGKKLGLDAGMLAYVEARLRKFAREGAPVPFVDPLPKEDDETALRAEFLAGLSRDVVAAREAVYAESSWGCDCGRCDATRVTLIENRRFHPDALWAGITMRRADSSRERERVAVDNAFRLWRAEREARVLSTREDGPPPIDDSVVPF